LPAGGDADGANAIMRKAGDPASKYTHAVQLARAQLVDSGQMNGREVGCHGCSPFIKYLPYLDYNNTWPIPAAHSCLFGVVKDFWNSLLCQKKQGRIEEQLVFSMGSVAYCLI